MRCAKRTQ